MTSLTRYRMLDKEQIDQTLRRLSDRIAERFPDSGLRRVGLELVAISEEAFDCVTYLERPNWGIRAGVYATIATMIGIVVLAASSFRVSGQVDRLSELVQLIDAAKNDIVFLGVAVYFLTTLETRIKRRRALRTLHELRSIVHIVDMHQLTKDPERLMSPQPDTPSSPERQMTAPELGRYLDYCSEMLSLTSKIAALFAQHFLDPVVLSTVNEIETLVTGLSGKIWQKITLLERVTRRPDVPIAFNAFDRRSPSELPPVPPSPR